MSKSAIITGVTGQDGAFLAELLLQKGYHVCGTYRAPNFWRLADLGVLGHERLELVDHDLTDLGASIRLLDRIGPHEVYNLAAQSGVHASFDQPIATAETTGVGAMSMLEAIRIVKSQTRFYQASSSELFGRAPHTPFNENTPFHPRSPYAVSKLFAHWATVNYREAFGLFSVCGILFNHESPLRGLDFVTRKISDAVAEIKLGKRESFELGNLDAIRDWGYAKEYVDGMWRMLQHDEPATFVLATGRAKTVRDFVSLSFKHIGVQIKWRGEGGKETGVDADSGRTLVRVNPKYYRPAEVDVVVGDASRVYKELGWKAKTSLEELCAMMVDKDLERRAHNC